MLIATIRMKARFAVRTWARVENISRPQSSSQKLPPIGFAEVKGIFSKASGDRPKNIAIVTARYKALPDVFTDFIAGSAYRRPERGEERRWQSPEAVAEHAEDALDDPAPRPPPSAMYGRNRLMRLVHQQDRQAIRRLDKEQEPWVASRQCIPPKRPGRERVDDMDGRGMDLFELDHGEFLPFRRSPEFGRGETPRPESMDKPGDLAKARDDYIFASRFGIIAHRTDIYYSKRKRRNRRAARSCSSRSRRV
jgi:hypothetical protein